MTNLTRRAFAKTTLAASAGTALSRMRILGANDRNNIGLIACGDRAMQIFTIFLKQPDVMPVAVCDVFEPYLERGAKAAEAREGAGKVARHGDFRRILDTKEIDTVVIATPDHW